MEIGKSPFSGYPQPVPDRPAGGTPLRRPPTETGGPADRAAPDAFTVGDQSGDSPEKVYQGELLDREQEQRPAEPLDYTVLIRQARMETASREPSTERAGDPGTTATAAQRAVATYRDMTYVGGPELMPRVDDFV